MARVAGPGELGPGGIDFGGAVASECERHAMAVAGRARPVFVERADRVLGVEREPQAAAEVDVHVRLLVGVGGNVEAQAAVEGQRRGHVGDHQLDQG